jgi:oxygen-independent coproporphyrinogen-3 oxidase
VSNYARPGFECRHNLNYWRGGDYLAAGCGAHGHRQGHRWWNERSTRRYIELMTHAGRARQGEELLTTPQRLSEIVLLGLRLREGISLTHVSKRLDVDVRAMLNGELVNLTQMGVVHDHEDVLTLHPDAVPLADAIALRLLPDEN